MFVCAYVCAYFAVLLFKEIKKKTLEFDSGC